MLCIRFAKYHKNSSYPKTSQIETSKKKYLKPSFNRISHQYKLPRFDYIVSCKLIKTCKIRSTYQP